jgi:hypothetical protein
MFVFLLEILKGRTQAPFFSTGLGSCHQRKPRLHRKTPSSALPPPPAPPAPPVSAPPHVPPPPEPLAPALPRALATEPPVLASTPSGPHTDPDAMPVDEAPPPVISKTTVLLPPALHASAHTFFSRDPFTSLPVDLKSPVGKVDSTVQAWFHQGLAAGMPQGALADVIEMVEVWWHIRGLDCTPFDLLHGNTQPGPHGLQGRCPSSPPRPPPPA